LSLSVPFLWTSVFSADKCLLCAQEGCDSARAGDREVTHPRTTADAESRPVVRWFGDGW
jgi:hypothetical protein